MKYENVLSQFAAKAQELSSKTCFRYKTKGKWEDITWLEVKDSVEKIASALQAKGIQAGDKVAIFCGTRYEWTLVDLAILSLGAVTVPIYHSTLPSDAEFILNHSETSILFVENKQQLKKIEGVKSKLPLLKEIIIIEGQAATATPFAKLLQGEVADAVSLEARVDKVPLDSIATIVYTSGTTGKPKGVVLTHKNFASEMDALKDVFVFPSNYEALLFLPLAHIFARAFQFYQLCNGFVQVYAESIDKLLDNVAEIRPHFMACVPRIFEKIYSKIIHDVNSSSPLKQKLFHWAVGVGAQVSRLKQDKKDVSPWIYAQYQIAKNLVFSKLHKKLGGRIQFFLSGGAPLSAEVAEFFHAADILIIEGYGLTETTAAINVNSPKGYKFGTVGPIVKHTEEKIANDGEIMVKGDHVFKEYYRDPEATKDAFTNGFFHTGDIGVFDSDGFLKITDRKKDIIVTAAGKNVAPQYIENLLKTDSIISQIMVHGDRRKFLSALVTLNIEEVRKIAETHKIDSENNEELFKHPKIHEAVRKRIEEKNKQLPSYETIKRFAIIEKDFSIEGGELTPTLKVKRKLVTERYKDVLDSLYNE